MVFIIILISLVIWGMVALEERKQKFKDELLLIEQQIKARREGERISAELEEYWQGLERMRAELNQQASFEKLKAELDQLVICQGCKYYYGRHGINCAIHPTGVNSECKDWENKDD